MICSFVLGLYPNKEAGKIYRYTNYDYLKNFFKMELSNEELKKITISNFLTKDNFFKSKTYYLKISSIDSKVSIKILKLLFFYKITNHMISIKDTDFKIINIYHNSIWAKQFNIEEFMRRELKKEIELKIFTPIFFKVGNEYRVSLEPIYIFKSIIKKFKKSSTCNDEFLEIIKRFNIQNIEKKEKNIKKRYIKQLKTEGITGNIIFKLETEDNEQLLLFNLLLYFSFFSGIGYMTEKGYGQSTSDLFIV